MLPQPDENASERFYPPGQSQHHPLAYFTETRLISTLGDTFLYPKEPFCALIYWERYLKTPGVGAALDVRPFPPQETQQAASARFTGARQVPPLPPSLQRMETQLFFEQVHLLLQHEVRSEGDASGWPVIFSQPHLQTLGPRLSALVQGISLSVITRAYLLTHEELFLQAAQRIVRTFERDILDGGISAPLGEDGICFEEVAVYPASHKLGGFLCALNGLSDYMILTDDRHCEHIFHRAHATLHQLCAEFDTGYWTRADLLQRDLASIEQHTLQMTLLKAFATHVQCSVCMTYAERWMQYSLNKHVKIYVQLNKHIFHYRHVFLHYVRRVLFPITSHTIPIRVGIPITGFPVTGGTKTVLTGISHIMQGKWQIEYLTQFVGPHAERYSVQSFGRKYTHPWQFPSVWFYCLAGGKKLFSLLRHGAGYHLLLPQDGVFTGAFAAIIGTLAGIRVVALDHGNLSLLQNQAYRRERMQAMTKRPLPYYRLLFARLQYRLYWPSLELLARISIRYVDHFLIPGVAGDEIDEACKYLKIGASRITRFASVIDMNDYKMFDSDEKADRRIRYGVAPDAIVIALVCRLAPEKGIDVALDALSYALSELECERRMHVQVIIAGDGPLRSQMEEQVYKRNLAQSIAFWGEISSDQVRTLLGLSDIFLYTSVRGACLSMSILEAMASDCAIVASPLPLANVRMLADGRGIIVPVGDAMQTGMALTSLLKDPERCSHMGLAARDYAMHYHSPAQFERTLLRVSGT